MKYTILSFGKCLNFKFQVSEGCHFLICVNTELKRSSGIFFFCFRTASLDGSGLNPDVFV